MSKFKEILSDVVKPAAVLFVICIIIPFALAATNKITKDRIAKLTEENNQKSMSSLVKADEFVPQSLKADDGSDIEYYCAEVGGEDKAYIFITSSKGYGGDVSVMTAIDTEGVIKGIDILDVSNETPGLGQNASKEGFYSQFLDKNGEVTVVKNGADSDANEVNAVTGATITSKAVTDAVNKAYGYYEILKGEGVV